MRNEHPDMPVPDLGDPLFAPFWKGTAAGHLVIQRCAHCRKSYWPPRYFCIQCNSFDLQWRPHEGRGELFTWTVVNKATAKGFLKVPYVVGIVTLSDDPTVRVVGNVVEVAHDDLHAGLRLSARFVPAGPESEANIVQWVPMDGR